MKILTFCLALIVMSCTVSLGQTYKVLWSFGSSPSDGAQPVSNLIADASGNLYGTTQAGGIATPCKFSSCGTVFELSPNSDGTWSETILYYFCSNALGRQCLDGKSPNTGLVFDAAGNLYGTTAGGGEGVACSDPTVGCGTVFELSPPSERGALWNETVLYNFCGEASGFTCLDGEAPGGQLVFDAAGNLFGTTNLGGTGFLYGGTVFQLSPGTGGWTHSILHNFCVNGEIHKGCPDGTRPYAGVTFDKSGNLYGTTAVGGAANGTGEGTVYGMSRDGDSWTFTNIVTFYQSANLSDPLGTVALDSGGNIYGTLSQGGNGAGAVFEIVKNSRVQRTFLFNGTDGDRPEAGLILDPKRRAAYGTTAGEQGVGNVFKIEPSGVETVLYTFCQLTNVRTGISLLLAC